MPGWRIILCLFITYEFNFFAKCFAAIHKWQMAIPILTLLTFSSIKAIRKLDLAR